MPELLPCPACGSTTEVRLQTPHFDDDGIVREAYFRCFACDLKSDDYPKWEPCHWHDTGSKPYAPLRDFWNKWARNYQEPFDA